MDENKIYDKKSAPYEEELNYSSNIESEHEAEYEGDTEININNNEPVADEVILDAEENGDEEISKKKKARKTPSWVITVILSLATTILFLSLFSIFILPRLKFQTAIYYSDNDGTSFSATIPDTPDSLNSKGVFEKCSPSVVYISSKGVIGGFLSQEITFGSGSGVIISEDGYIITNSSLINSGTNLKVSLSNGNEYDASLVKNDRRSDAAILKIDANGLTPVVLGNSNNLNVGDIIHIISNPLAPEIRNTLNLGFISGINNNVTLQKGTTLNLLQVDVSGVSGCFGSPLLNSKGEIMGLITGSVSSSSGMVFATPINDIKPLIDSVLNTNLSETYDDSLPMLGITATEEAYGIVVETVSENYPAAKAGVKVGDVIIKADGKTIKTVNEINQIRLSHKSGDAMTLTILRDGEIVELLPVLE